jgi:hypothetical protein
MRGPEIAREIPPVAQIEMVDARAVFDARPLRDRRIGVGLHGEMDDNAGLLCAEVVPGGATGQPATDQLRRSGPQSLRDDDSGVCGRCGLHVFRYDRWRCCRYLVAA